MSVVIPTYNGGDLLMQAIYSCFQQNPLNVEVIVVDDASVDDTPDRVAMIFPQVRLIRQPHNSGSGAHGRNTGLNHARGRFVKFLDHDDVLEHGTLPLEVDAADKFSCDMVMTRWGDVCTDNQGHLIESSRRSFIPPKPERLLEAILLGEKVPYTAGVLYRRTFIADQLWDSRLTINDDFDWFCRNALRTNRIVRLDHVSYYWRLHTASIQGSQIFNSKSFVESVFIHNHIFSNIANTLRCQDRLTSSICSLLVRQLYSDLRVLVRFSPDLCWRTIKLIRTLQPGFHPDITIEKSFYLLLLSRYFGLTFSLLFYRWFLIVPDMIRFRAGRVRYFRNA
ncbi:glycosyltransferase [Synechococcus sp. AH-736-G20]|nr:glycosyltransferase [Synechococcus sp. AH-736-G20]